MTLTVGSLLFIYYAFLALFGIFAFVDIWHMVKFGTYGTRNYIVLFLFLAGTAIAIWGTFTLLDGVNWARPLFTGLELNAGSGFGGFEI